MPEDEVVQPEVTDNLQQQDDAPDAEPDTYEPEYDDEGFDQHGYDADNLDRDGNPPPTAQADEVEDAPSEGRTPLPAARAAEGREGRPTTPAAPAVQAQQRTVYTYDTMFRPEEKEHIETLSLTDPVRAAVETQKRMKELDAYATGVFREDMETYAAANPELVAGLRDSIERAIPRLSVDQLQGTNAASWLVGQVIAEKVAKGGLEALRPLLGAKAAQTPVKVVERSARRVMPPAERVPRVGNGSPTARTRPAAVATGNTTFEKELRKVYPNLSDREIAEYMDSTRKHVSNDR